jgi:hypothetical protein
MQGISDEADFKLRRVMAIIDHFKLHLRRVNVSGPAELDCEKPGAGGDGSGKKGKGGRCRAVPSRLFRLIGGDDKFTDSSLHPEIAGKAYMNLGAILPDNMLHF